jgi:sensor domain CHASE-containing protein
MSIEFIFLVIILNVIWFFLLLKYNSKEEKMKREIERGINAAYEHLKNMLILRAEQVEDMIYLYNQHTNEFVCQGKNFTELQDALHKRFPGRKSLIDQGCDIVFKENVNVK